MESKILNIIAVQKPSTVKPVTILPANKISNVLITSKNNPKVIMVTGNVKMTKIGFKKANRNPKTKATIMATVKLSTCTPFKKFAINKTAAADSNILKINFIELNFLG